MTLTVAILLSAATCLFPGQNDNAVDFEKQIRPILERHCVKCHGATTQKSNLRLDVRRAALKGGDNGPVIAPGKSSASELLRRVTSSDPEDRMPPEKPPLDDVDIERLRRWIDAGADWPETDDDRAASHDARRDHWAWQPLSQPVPPDQPEESAGLVRNEIDRFILAKLNEHQLSLSPEADRRTLIRRLSFDLLGLPPAADDIDGFVNDGDPRAVEILVDRMLASPHYGERWAGHWLDIAHYADTHGFERDQRRDNAWPYRDWVIRALNSDLPYDQFLRDQIAGDILRPDDPDAVAATGFLAAGPWDFVGQAETPSPVLKRQARADDLDDMVTQVMTAACGVTINCARCHDHKLDPISQQEYYSLWAVFAGVKRGDRVLSAAEQQQLTERKEELEQELSKVRGALTLLEGIGWTPEQGQAGQTQITLLRQRLEDLGRSIETLPAPAKIYAVTTESPPVISLLQRGNPEQPGDVVTPGTISCVPLPASFGSNHLTDSERRIALADWIVAPQNPLTARVIVNRLWHHHFGVGLVETPSDFGLGGGLPSHPELLEWLAVRLQQAGWSLKSIHRLICLSATYRQSSSQKPQQHNPPRETLQRALAVDAGNRLLWRQNPRRLDAESLRDSVLTVSGKLETQMFGPGYRDFDYREEYAPVYTYITADAPRLWRRSVYRFIVRTTPNPFLTTLDCPNAANLTPTRNVTTTALQSLALLNHEFMLKQAEYFGLRLAANPDATEHEQVQLAFRLAFGRDPSSAETEAGVTLLESSGAAEFCRALMNANEFVYVD